MNGENGESNEVRSTRQTVREERGPVFECREGEKKCEELLRKLSLTELRRCSGVDKIAEEL